MSWLDKLIKKDDSYGWIEYSKFTLECSRRKFFSLASLVFATLLILSLGANYVNKRATRALELELAKVSQEAKKAEDISFRIIQEKEYTIREMRYRINQNETMHLSHIENIESEFGKQIDELEALIEQKDHRITTYRDIVYDMPQLLGMTNVIVDTNNLRVRSNATESQINALLERTPVEGMGWEFLVAEREHNVNAIILVSIFRRETNLGAVGVGATHNNLGGVTDGMGGFRNFESLHDSIHHTASLLDTQYLSPSGRFYNGVSLRGVNSAYAVHSDGSTNWGWAEIIERFVAEYLYMLN